MSCSLGARKIKEKEAVLMSYCELGVGWMGWMQWVSGWDIGGWVGGWVTDRFRPGR